MRLPTIAGLIERRILVNYRVDPDVLANCLPPPFRPLTVGGYGAAGICLIRLAQIRPKRLPRWAGLFSENAANRIAEEWGPAYRPQTGVYVLRRDTSSRWNALAGGRVFPGIHHHARFQVQETQDQLSVAFASDDRSTLVEVKSSRTECWPSDSIFRFSASPVDYCACG